MIEKYKFTSKKIAVILFTALILSLATGCNTDFTKDTPFDKGTPTEAVTTGTGTDNPTPSTDTKPNTTDPATNPVSGNGTVTDTQNPDQPTDSAGENTQVPTSSEVSATPEPEITSIPTASPTPSIRDTFNRDEYWDKTFLVWLPKFEAGAFSGQNSAGTYDYATFNNVASEDVTSYIRSLKDAGFTNIGIENYSDSSISFVASNNKSWEVKISYTDGTMVLGSGFNDSTEENDDKADALYTTTMLQYMPRFQKGTYLSSETRSDNSMYTSIIYTGVTKEDVLTYINEVKNKGYIYVEDEDEQDDMLWYIALNEERFECHVEFSGSELKIGCGYMDED